MNSLGSVRVLLFSGSERAHRVTGGEPTVLRYPHWYQRWSLQSMVSKIWLTIRRHHCTTCEFGLEQVTQRSIRMTVVALPTQRYLSW